TGLGGCAGIATPAAPPRAATEPTDVAQALAVIGPGPTDPVPSGPGTASHPMAPDAVSAPPEPPVPAASEPTLGDPPWTIQQPVWDGPVLCATAEAVAGTLAEARAAALARLHEALASELAGRPADTVVTTWAHRQDNGSFRVALLARATPSGPGEPQ
ncbi:MAG TPA: hypothetical protein VD963_00965, partial [Phycisphaerales bacterium]|nr:hypothetical protein [Phycisphaerales bacterium]